MIRKLLKARQKRPSFSLLRFSKGRKMISKRLLRTTFHRVNKGSAQTHNRRNNRFVIRYTAKHLSFRRIIHKYR